MKKQPEKKQQEKKRDMCPYCKVELKTPKP